MNPDCTDSSDAPSPDVPVPTLVTKGQLISKGLVALFSILPKNERKISAPVG